MLRSLNGLLGYNIEALDGTIGTVYDFYFDEIDWALRYLVVDTGMLLSGRKVLIVPAALGQPDWATRLFPVNHTEDEIKASPGINLDQPVSRKSESALHEYYQWAPYWAPGFPSPSMPAPIPPKPLERVPEEGRRETHVRSLREITGYHVACTDKDIGHVDDFIAEIGSWHIKMVVVDTRNWLPGKHVLLAIEWIDRLARDTKKVHFNLPAATVKDAPAYDPTEPVNEEFEAQLYDYYGRPSARV
jgi:hypothetical protein